MGRVFRAAHLQTGEVVALKTVNKVTRSRLLALRQEIAALQSVKHPGLVRFVDQGNHQGVPWYAMELLTGRTLAHYNDYLWDADLEITRSGVSLTGIADERPNDHLARRSSSAFGLERQVAAQAAVAGGALNGALRLYHQLCEPLGHIHGRGMVHRDLKPSNVFIRADERPVLMDFGLIGYASGAIGREVLDAGNHGFGTVHYVAPERIEGRHADARADLYALGCMLYETLLGRPPFTGEAGHIISQHLSAAPIPPSEILSGVPPRVEALILALLAKSPQTRIGHASDVAGELANILWGAGAVHSIRAEPVPLFRPQLSGREDALVSLGGALERARAKNGEMILIGGESGIGKTFLTSELARSATKQGFRVVTGEALPFAPAVGTARAVSGGPFHALRRLLQTIADTCRELGPAERERVLGGRALYLAPYEPSLEPFVEFAASAQPDTLPGAAGSDRIITSFVNVLREYSCSMPLLLIVDDLQWADNLTLSLLQRLNRSFFEGLPLLVIGAYRTDHANTEVDALRSSGECTAILLGKLEERDVGSMVADMLASSPPGELTQFLVKESEGNPFFVAEYLRYLVSESYLERSEGRWALAVERTGGQTDYTAVRMPSKLEDLLRWRLEALSPESQAVIDAAAVLGRRFSVDVLAQTAALAEDALLPVLREAQERQVIESMAEGSYRFTHDKLCEATYGALSGSARIELHSRAANAIESNPSALESPVHRARELARHCKLAGEHSRAIEHFARAGEEGLRRSALHDAIYDLRSALELAQSVGGNSGAQRARWERMLGGALHDIGEFAEGSIHLRRALSLLGERSRGTHPAILGGLTLLELIKQSFHRLAPTRESASDRGDASALLERARIHDRLQQAAYYMGDVLPMLYECLRTLNLAERAPASPTLTVAYANAHAVAGVLPARGLVRVYEGLARKSMAAAPNKVSEGYFHMLAGVYLTGIGAWSQALASLDAGLALCLSVNFEQRAREIVGAISICQFLAGDYALAKENAREVEVKSTARSAHTYCWGLLGCAQVALVEGRLHDAVTDVERSKAILNTLGRPERIWGASLLAYLSAKLGDRETADRESKRALEEIAQAPTVTHFTIDAVARCAEVRIWLSFVDRPVADGRRLARGALRNLQKTRKAFPIAEPREELMLGYWHLCAGHEVAADRHFRASLDASQKLGMKYDEARALLAFGRTAESSSGRAILSSLSADGDAALLL